MATFSLSGSPAAAPALDVLLLQIDPELYAIPSSSVREVARYRSFTRVPGAPPELPGILNQRGVILPIVELRLLLGLAPTTITRAARLVVVAHDDVEMALVVDAALDLLTLPLDSIEPPPPGLDPVRARFLRGIARHEAHPVAVLDLGELLAALRERS